MKMNVVSILTRVIDKHPSLCGGRPFSGYSGPAWGFCGRNSGVRGPGKAAGWSRRWTLGESLSDLCVERCLTRDFCVCVRQRQTALIWVLFLSLRIASEMGDLHEKGDEGLYRLGFWLSWFLYMFRSSHQNLFSLVEE